MVFPPPPPVADGGPSTRVPSSPLPEELLYGPEPRSLPHVTPVPATLARSSLWYYRYRAPLAHPTPQLYDPWVPLLPPSPALWFPGTEPL